MSKMVNPEVGTRGRIVAHGNLKPTIERQVQIIFALMMHDIKARFFGNGLGYVAMMAWPLIHIVAIILVSVMAGRPQPYGNSMVLYAATGVIPFIASTYIAKFMLLGAITNKAFLQYPIIKVMDLMSARAVLELVNISIVVLVIFIGILLMGVDCTPNSPTDAAEALLSSMVLGLGLGYLNGPITMIFPLWNLVFALFTLAAYASSGILFLPGSLPLQFQYYLSFNPVLQGVVWMRCAFYPGFDAHILDKYYMLECGFGALVLGLISERLFRKMVLNAR